MYGTNNPYVFYVRKIKYNSRITRKKGGSIYTYLLRRICWLFTMLSLLTHASVYYYSCYMPRIAHINEDPFNFTTKSVVSSADLGHP